MKSPIQVTILGQQYTVKSSSPAEQIEQVADYVNSQLAAVAGAAPTADTRHITVLTLLNIAGSYLELVEGKGGGADAARLEALLKRIEQACPD